MGPIRRLYLFGQPELFDADGRPLSVRTSTSLHLLAYLCRRRGEVRARDRVALERIEASLQGHDRRLFERTAATLQASLDEGDRQTAIERVQTILWLRL